MGKCAKFLLIIGLCLIIQRSAQAERICSVSDYRGTYAFQGTGAFVDLPPEAAALAGPFAQAGTFTSDGHGNAFIDTVNSFNGIISPTADGAMYTVTPECEVRFNLVLPILNVPATFYGVLSHENRVESGEYRFSFSLP